MFMNFYFINSKLIYSFGSLSLKPEQRSRAVHFTVLAPNIYMNTEFSKMMYLLDITLICSLYILNSKRYRRPHRYILVHNYYINILPLNRMLQPCPCLPHQISCIFWYQRCHWFPKHGTLHTLEIPTYWIEYDSKLMFTPHCVTPPSKFSVHFCFVYKWNITIGALSSMLSPTTLARSRLLWQPCGPLRYDICHLLVFGVS